MLDAPCKPVGACRPESLVLKLQDEEFTCEAESRVTCFYFEIVDSTPRRNSTSCLFSDSAAIARIDRHWYEDRINGVDQGGLRSCRDRRLTRDGREYWARVPLNHDLVSQ